MARSRFQFRFSLRTLLIGVTVAGILSYLAAQHCLNTRNQAAIVKLIREAGGHVIYDYELHYLDYSQYFGSNTRQLGNSRPEPQWLSQWLGVDFFHDVVAADVNDNFSEPEIGREVVRRIGDLTSLQGLSISDDLAEENLKSLSKLTSLQYLETPASGVTFLTNHPHLEELKVLDILDGDRFNFSPLAELAALKSLDAPPEALRFLGGHAGLEKLYFRPPFWGEPVDYSAEEGYLDSGSEQALSTLSGLKHLGISLADEELKVIGSLRNLESLCLYDCEHVGEGLQCLAGLPRLKVLYLRPGLPCDDTALEFVAQIGSLEEIYLDLYFDIEEGLTYLQQLPRLRILDLGGAQIDHHALQPIEQMTGLEQLHLNHTRISSESLVYLTHLPKLRELSLHVNKGISDRAVPYIVAMPALETVTVWKTNISAEGRARIRSKHSSIDFRDSNFPS